MAPPTPIGCFIPPVTGVNGSLRPVANSFDPSGTFRSRIGSVKRRRTDGNSSEIENAFDLSKPYPPLLFPDASRIDLAGVKNLLVTAAEESRKLESILADDNTPPSVRVVADSAMAVYKLVEAIVEKAVVPMWKRQDFIPAAHAQTANENPTPPVAEGERELRAALETADLESVVFDADLGPLPTFNRSKLSAAFSAGLKNTIIKKATDGGADAAEAVRQLDDAFTAVEDVDFMGKETKIFTNPKDSSDERNGKFCTMPVKLRFTDKDSRIYFETTVKKLGGPKTVQSFPTPIRKEMAAVSARIKAANKDMIVMVRPNTRTLKWNISMKKDGDAKWIRDGVEPIDASIMLPRFRSDTGATGTASQSAGGPAASQGAATSC